MFKRWTGPYDLPGGGLKTTSPTCGGVIFSLFLPETLSVTTLRGVTFGHPPDTPDFRHPKRGRVLMPKSQKTLKMIKKVIKKWSKTCREGVEITILTHFGHPFFELFSGPK
jgi:hypothetical protein